MMTILARTLSSVFDTVAAGAQASLPHAYRCPAVFTALANSFSPTESGQSWPGFGGLFEWLRARLDTPEGAHYLFMTFIAVPPEPWWSRVVM